ncbi:PKD domain-containing protein [[Eubacterium] cellulosolvens]
MKTKFATIGIILLLVLGSFLGIIIIEDDTSTVEAATLIVGPGQTYTTIQSAINAAGSGATIYVYNGTYKENLVINKKVSLIGNGTNWTFIDGQGSGNVITITSNGVELSGFTVKNGGSNPFDAGVKLNNINNCIISNNNISTNQFYGVYIYQGSDNTIKDNNISSNNVMGLYISDSPNNNISGNNIELNGYGEINTTEPDGGIWLLYSNNNAILNNKIINNFFGIAIQNSHKNFITYNNIEKNLAPIVWNFTNNYNFVYLNHFIGNTENAVGSGGLRFWNSTKPLAYIFNNTNFTNYLGNYYDDYAGTDSNGDGIGDTPYTMSSDTDYFPLVERVENYTLIPTSIKIDMMDTNSNITGITVSLLIQEATLNASVTGDFNGTVNITNLELIIINSSSFTGSGFFKSNWSATIEGKPYYGNLHGMLFQKPGERKIYLKGTVSGGLSGITDGYFIEAVSGSGTYDLYNSTWTLNYLGSELVFAKLTLNGTVTYVKSENTKSLIYILQSCFKGKSKGYYTGFLNLVLTHVCINNKTNKYHGEGFSIITYVSKYGSGTGWTYDRNVSKETVKLTGYFTEPLWGPVTGTLIDGEQIKSISLSITRIDIGLPPQPIIQMGIWGRLRVSPGQTVNYLLEYRNIGLKSANNTDIIMALPKKTNYISSTCDGVYNSSTHEVVWRRNITEKSKNLVTVKCRVYWGLTTGTKLYCNGSVKEFIKNSTLAKCSFISEVIVAQDPNLKYGPEGNVTPGQKLNYKLEYENEGAGIAFGVYFIDELSVLLNDSSLEIGPVISTSNSSIIAPPGIYDPDSRTITWFVGEVGPGEGGYANISINVSETTPHAAPIINYGIVYFPSVPEVTRTNGIVSIVKINQGPVAFAGTNLTVYTLQNIIFNGSGSYDPDGFIMNYTWSFGDGTFGYGKFATHSYLDDGNYTVTLTVKDDFDVIDYHEIYIEVLNRRPEAKFRVDSTVVETNTEVTFNASNSIDLDGSISEYYFDFGDGSNSGWVQTTELSHKYTFGTQIYTVKLQVKDDDDALSTNIAEIKITVNNREPEPILTVEPTEAYTYEDIFCGAELSTDLDGYISEYYFDFGDGSTSGWVSTNSVSHQYTDGTKEYTISLKVKDDFGTVGSDISTKKITINNRKPVVDLSIEDTVVNTLDAVTFDASGSSDQDGAELEYYFDFGDGSNSGWVTESIINHTYSTGTQEYTITLTVKDEDGETNTTSLVLTVLNRPPVADAGDDLEVEVSQTVHFDGTRSYDPDGEITLYKWNFGDGSTSGWITSGKTTHEYIDQGIYTVTLVVSDGALSSSDTCLVNVIEREKDIPVILSDFPTEIELDEDFGEWSITVTKYESHCNPEYTGDDLNWYVTGNSGIIFSITGDLSTRASADTFVFTSFPNANGIEVLTYHLTDPDGFEATIDQTVIVNQVNDPPLEPAIDVEIVDADEKTREHENLTVTFTASYPSDMVYPDPDGNDISELHYTWHFNDGSNAKYGLMVKHTFPEQGKYTVTLTVTDPEGLINTAIKEVQVLEPVVVDDSGIDVNVKDLDGDGMPNDWEVYYDLDPNNPNDAELDKDKDLLSNLHEYNLGTNPTKYDTDSDGISDLLDEFPTDPTRPKQDTTPEERGKDFSQVYILLFVIILIVIIAIIPIVIRNRRRELIGKPYTQDRILREVSTEVLTDSEGQNLKFSRDRLKKKLERSYRKGEISEETYKYIESDILYPEDDH